MAKRLMFNDAFRYPFNRAKGMLNILWILLPIIGWFALGGYTIRIVQEQTKLKFKELPKFKFKKDLKLGASMFLKAIPFVFFMMMAFFILFMPLTFLNSSASSVIEFFIRAFLELIIMPILVINFLNKMTVASFFEFKILKHVFGNFNEYAIAMGKTILLGIIFFFMSIILVGIPANAFTQNIFMAEFYKRRVR